MTDSHSEYRGNATEIADHRDGMIRLSHHAPRLAELTQGVVKTEFPISMFEPQDGQVTEEQVQILDFYTQEVKTSTAKVVSQSGIITMIMERIEANPSLGQKLLEKLQDVRRFIHDADYAIAEVDELSTVLSKTVADIEAGQVSLISEEQMAEEIKDLEKKREGYISRKREINQKRMPDRTPEEGRELLLLSGQESEVSKYLSYYHLLPKLNDYAQEEIQIESTIAGLQEKQLTEPLTEDEEFALNNYLQRAHSMAHQLRGYRFLVNNTSGFYPDARAGLVIMYYHMLQDERKQYAGPLPEGQKTERQRLLDLATSPAVQQAAQV